jgi:hypothetical protein
MLLAAQVHPAWNANMVLGTGRFDQIGAFAIMAFVD